MLGRWMGGAMDHPESDYIKRVLGEPLKDALSAVVLHQPLDPIDFLANYLKYWAIKVRDYRCRKIATLEMERILAAQIPFNIQLQAERAIRAEQNFLKGERMRVEEEERRRQAELQRRRELTQTKATMATNTIRLQVWPLVLDEVVDMATEVAFKVWRRMERERLKAEKAARRAAAKESDEDAEEDEGLEDKEDEDEDEEEESKLLREAQLNAHHRNQNFGGVSSKMNLIFLGQQFSGKSALITRLRKELLVGKKNSAVAFAYNYIDLNYAEGENRMRVNAWTMATNLGMEKHLRFILNQRTIWNSLILICVSLGEPWEMENSINQALQLVEEQITQMHELYATELEELQSSLERHFRGYIDPAMTTNPPIMPTSPNGRRLSVILNHSDGGSEGGDDEGGEEWQWNFLHPADLSDPENPLPPLNDGACKRKMHVPILIVVTKSDLIKHLQNDLGYSEETLDAIQLRLRKMAFEIGAGLIYTSAREDTNISLLNRYLQHRLFGEEFLDSALILPQEIIFIPAGWDTEGKMKALPVSLSEESGRFPCKPSMELRMSLRNSARGFASPYASRGANDALKKEEIVEVKDTQSFLNHIYNKLNALEMREKENWKHGVFDEDTIIKRFHPCRAASIPVGMERRKKLRENAEEDEDEDEAAVLSNFFTKLLNKRHSMAPQVYMHAKKLEDSFQEHRLAIQQIRLRARNRSSGDRG
ncbi:Cytoplasmic dynein 1 light intermediate chain 2 [Taenia crassiceps]|uniref:Dynein light intermediate chain n=1 Tax=Taenia crassiceps TaxID=6207 RepID=A0ABR4Q2I2_9CEST